METARVVLPLYLRRYHQNRFPQTPRLAILCFMRYEDGTFREAEVRLAWPRELRGTPGLSSIPHYTTPDRFLERLGHGPTPQALGAKMLA